MPSPAVLLSAPRATIFIASSGRGRFSVFASSQGALPRRQDDRHRFGMDWFNDGIRRHRLTR
jgi:hypothetical protein